MDDLAALEGGAQRTLEAVFEVEPAGPGDDVGEEIPEEGRVLRQEGVQVEGALGGDEPVEAHLARVDRSPLFQAETMGRVGAPVADFSKNHSTSIAGCPFIAARGARVPVTGG